MDILDRMTDRTALQQMLANRKASRGASFINAADMARQINQRVIGQEVVISEIVTLVVSSAAKERRRTPVGIFLISGPSGTGKSELGKALGDAMPGGGGHYLVPMQTLKDQASISTLLGASPGYVGSQQKAGLVSHLMANPRTVVILDEFEKSCREAQELFLTAWEEGYFRESTRHAPVSVTNVVFILTANAHEEEIAKLALQQQHAREQQTMEVLTEDEMSDRCKAILRGTFSAPVLSRIERCFAFAPLSPEALAAITLKMIVDEADDYQLTLYPVPPQILLPYVVHHHRTGFDARALRHHVRKDFGVALSTLKQAGAQVIEVVYDAKTETMALRDATDSSGPVRKTPRGSKTVSA